MIDEKVLIERLEEYKYSHLVEHDKERLEHCTENESTEHCEGIDCFWCVWDKSISIVNQLAEEQNNGWIPCSERLPKEYTEVLGCDYEGIISVVELYKDNVFGMIWEQWNGGNLRLNVIKAWQPLPHSYKGV